MGNPTIGENKGADQLRSNCKADQRICFRYTDSTILPLSKSKISILYPCSVTVQSGLCRTRSETQIVGFPTDRLTKESYHVKQTARRYGLRYGTSLPFICVF